jgi:hypothetical protein
VLLLELQHLGPETPTYTAAHARRVLQLLSIRVVVKV